MLRKPIRNLRSKKAVPPRVFDVLVDGPNVDLEIKTEKGTVERVSWEDVQYQVNIAKEQQ